MFDKVKVAKLYGDAVLPVRKNPTDAGMDFYAYGDYIIEPSNLKVIETGITVEIPVGYMLLLKPKSRNNWLVGAGVIDAMYEPGQVLVKVINIFNRPIAIKHGDPIAQGIFVKIATPEIEEVSIDVFKPKSARSGKGGIVSQAHFISVEEAENF